MERPRGFALAAYLVGATLIVMPLVDVSVAVSPPHVDDYRWRFGAAGLFANAVMLPNAGLLLLLATAISYGHAAIRRTLGVVAWVSGVLCVIAIAMFGLDALQTRPAVQPGMEMSFTLASVSAATKLLVAGVTLFALGIVGVGGMKRRTRVKEAAPMPPIVSIDPGSRAQRS